ncbi:MAG TPA: response regulator, partial [bacterium]|nr:response regulator [bacterium]
SDLWTTEVDKGQISQVIGNLVINAQQAMPDGETINIKAENVNVTPKDNLPLQGGNYIKISVGDKGIGIPAEQLTKIFDPYFTTKQKGSGLGLATTYSIIHRHDGHITVKSEIGIGTTFHIYLPASAEQVKKKEGVKEETTTITGKILVMDDEEMVRNFVSKALKSFGNETEVARDGAEAIEKYKKAMDSDKPFDAVILDLTIPGGMGGKQAVKKLLEIDSDAKAVVSSGYANDPVVSNFEAYGFSGFIPKPYMLEELKKVLNNVMSEKKY